MECTPQRSSRYSSPSRPQRVLPSSILRRVSSTSTSSAAPCQPLRRCTQERATAPCEVRVCPQGKERLSQQRPTIGSPTDLIPWTCKRPVCCWQHYCDCSPGAGHESQEPRHLLAHDRSAHAPALARLGG